MEHDTITINGKVYNWIDVNPKTYAHFIQLESLKANIQSALYSVERLITKVVEETRKEFNEKTDENLHES